MSAIKLNTVVLMIIIARPSHDLSSKQAGAITHSLIVCYTVIAMA